MGSAISFFFILDSTIKQIVTAAEKVHKDSSGSLLSTPT